MYGPLRLSFELLANYVPKCQMSSGPHGPIFYFQKLFTNKNSYFYFVLQVYPIKCCFGLPFYLTQYFIFVLISNISEANVNSVHCTNPLHDLDVCEGDNIDLEVTLSDLEPEVIWLHNGTVLQESMWVSMTSEGHRRKLTMYSSSKKDEGIYACVLKEHYTPAELKKCDSFNFL